MSAWFGVLLVVCTVGTALRFRRNLPLNCVTVAPLVCTVGGFALWQGSFDDYWFLTVTPAVALTIGLALTSWRRGARLIAVALAITVILMQPSRLRSAMTIHRLPEYRLLLNGSQEILAHTTQIRQINTVFPLPPSTDREFLFKVLGGRVTPDSGLVATIGQGGGVTFSATSP